MDDSGQSLHNRPELKERRRELRANATPAEKLLWSKLRRRQLAGRRFRRQHSIGPYIVDFYCPAANIAIELDGGHHYGSEASARDADRDTFLKAHGITVMRFDNREVYRDIEEVLAQIQRAF